MHPLIAQLEDALTQLGTYEPHPGALVDCRRFLESLEQVCETGGQAFATVAERFREALPSAAEGGDGIAEFGAAFVALEDHAADAVGVLVDAHAETFDRIDSGDVSMDTTTNADAAA